MSEPAAHRPAARLPSLRDRLVRHVLLPLALVWLTGTAVVIAIATHFADAAFDRALLDDALGLAASVTPDGAQLRVRLSSDDLAAVLFDQSETVHFVVRTLDGEMVAGDPRLRAPVADDPPGPEFSDLQFLGETVRAVRLQREQPLAFELVLAQTTRNRAALRERLLLFSAVPQALLLVLLGLWLRRAISRDLQPVAQLQHELNRRDVTDLRPLAQRVSTLDMHHLAGSIDGLMARLDHALRAQREFSGNVAHELRTPLAGIRALAEYGLAQRDPAQWREQLQAVLHSQDRASRLVNQLLALALADEEQRPASLHPVALDELVQRVVLQALPRADALGVDLGAQGLDEPMWVRGDEALLEGALQNLLDNALRHARPPAGSAASVTVEVQRSGQQVTLAVLDTGPGIAPAQRSRLRERWQRGSHKGALEGPANEGAGLGLAIVSRYAQLLGSELALGAGPGGQGTRAALVLQSAAAPPLPA